MKLRVKVNQAEAFRKGIDAPTSIIDVEVDPAKLTAEQRRQIADRLEGIELHMRGYGFHNAMVEVTSPTLEGILAAVQANEDKVQAEKAKAEKEEKDQLAKAEKSFAERKTHKRSDYTRGVSFEWDYATDESLIYNLLGKRPEVKAWFDELSEGHRKARAAAEAKADKREEKAAAEKKAEEDKLASIIRKFGSKLDKERLSRGLLKSWDIDDLVQTLLRHEVFKECPLPVLAYPDVDDLDLDDYNSSRDREYDDSDELPEESYDEKKVDQIDNDLMARIMEAENKLKAWKPDLKFQAEPWKFGTTRKSKNIGWLWNVGLMVTTSHDGLTVARAFAI